MIQKIALLVGGLGAAAVLAFALGLTNFVFAGPGAIKQTADSQPAAQTDVSVAAAANGSGTKGTRGDQAAQPQTKKVIDKVYIAPTPAPATVRVPAAAPGKKQTTPAAQPKAPTAAPAWHDDGRQESERAGGKHGRERGDD